MHNVRWVFYDDEEKKMKHETMVADIEQPKEKNI